MMGTVKISIVIFVNCYFDSSYECYHCYYYVLFSHGSPRISNPARRLLLWLLLLSPLAQRPNGHCCCCCCCCCCFRQNFTLPWRMLANFIMGTVGVSDTGIGWGLISTHAYVYTHVVQCIHVPVGVGEVKRISPSDVPKSSLLLSVTSCGCSCLGNFSGLGASRRLQAIQVWPPAICFVQTVSLTCKAFSPTTLLQS